MIENLVWRQTGRKKSQQTREHFPTTGQQSPATEAAVKKGPHI